MKCSFSLHLSQAEGPDSISHFLHSALSLLFYLTCLWVVSYEHPRANPAQEVLSKYFKTFQLYFFNQFQSVVCLKLKKKNDAKRAWRDEKPVPFFGSLSGGP